MRRKIAAVIDVLLLIAALCLAFLVDWRLGLSLFVYDAHCFLAVARAGFVKGREFDSRMETFVALAVANVVKEFCKKEDISESDS